MAAGAVGTPHYQAALIALKVHQLEKAETEINASATEFPKDGDVMILKAQILFENGHFEDSQAILKPLGSTRGPNQVRALTTQADILLRHGQFTQSAQIYNRLVVIATPPESERLKVRLVYCAVGQGDWLTASKIIATLDPEDPHFPGYYFAQAAASRGLGDQKRSDDLIQSARSLHGNPVVDEELDFFLKVFEKPVPAPKPK
jgi:predicted Zn-dependent protease